MFHDLPIRLSGHCFDVHLLIRAVLLAEKTYCYVLTAEDDVYEDVLMHCLDFTVG